MPYVWVKAPEKASERSGAFSHAEGYSAAAVLRLWPFRSLPRRGFVWFIGITAAMISLPLLALLGTMALWGVLPFLVLAVAGVWWGLQSSYRAGELSEVLSIWPDRVELVRTAPDGARLDWTANPYWVEVTLHADSGPVEQYLTLRGGGREVELGAFLTPEERVALAEEVGAALRGIADRRSTE